MATVKLEHRIACNGLFSLSSPVFLALAYPFTHLSRMLLKPAVAKEFNLQIETTFPLSSSMRKARYCQGTSEPAVMGTII
jgi:hypothetical protein